MKTVLCQLKQDFTQSWNGLYVIWWYGTNLKIAKKKPKPQYYKFDKTGEKRVDSKCLQYLESESENTLITK